MTAGTLTVSNGLTNAGAGTMSISSGATLTTSGALTNSSTAASGITIDGTLTETGDTVVSNTGTVTLASGTLSDTGTGGISNTGTLTSSGTSTLTGGTGNTSNTGAFNVTGGTLTVSNGLTNSGAGTMSISSGATLSTSGALTNNSTTSGGITIDGTLTDSSATALSNTGTITLVGTLSDTGTGGISNRVPERSASRRHVERHQWDQQHQHDHKRDQWLRHDYRRDFGHWRRRKRAAGRWTLPVTPRTGVTGFQIESGSTLEFASSVTSVASSDTVTFESANTGTILDLTSSSISGNELGGFAGTIAGLNAGSTATNEIDLSSIPIADVQSTVLTGDVLTVDTTCWRLQPSAERHLRATTVASFSTDGSSGTDLFLLSSPTTFRSEGSVDFWEDPASWGGAVPPADPPGNLTFINNSTGANYIYMPASLQQDTGSATWTIEDTNGITNQYTSSLSLVNQGTIFVNSTNTFTPGSPVTWTLTGAATGSQVGQQFFENDSAVNVIDGNTAIFHRQRHG